MKKSKTDTMIHAKVVVEFSFPNVCLEHDLKDTNMSFEEMVNHLIKEEGLFGVVADDFKILKIERKR
jgi:hypothetical protein